MLSQTTRLAALLIMMSPVAAFAQANKPAGDGSVSPTVMQVNPSAPAADRDPAVPGATGDSRVVGDNSTISGDSNATIEQRTGLAPSSDGGGD